MKSGNQLTNEVHYTQQSIHYNLYIIMSIKNYYYIINVKNRNKKHFMYSVKLFVLFNFISAIFTILVTYKYHIKIIYSVHNKHNYKN